MSSSYNKRKTKLIDFYENKARLPSFSEMQGLFNVSSKNTVSYWVEKFIKEGLIARDKQGKLVPKAIDGKIKILGYVEAGFPSAAEEELLDVISLDKYLIINRQATFLLEVSNDSMIEAGIHPGDLVLVERGGKRFSSSIARTVRSNPTANPVPATDLLENLATKLSNLSPPSKLPIPNFSITISQIGPVE